MQNENSNYISISDLALVSYLALYFKVIELQPIDQNKWGFIFENTNELKNTIDIFYKGEALVSPIHYYNSIKNLKGRLYTVK